MIRYSSKIYDVELVIFLVTSMGSVLLTLCLSRTRQMSLQHSHEEAGSDDSRSLSIVHGRRRVQHILSGRLQYSE